MAGDKGALRTAVLQRRALLPYDARRRADDERTARLLERLTTPPPTVAAYLSEQGEPDTWALVAHLHAAGVRVLLPVLRRSPDWALFAGEGDVRVGRLGIAEPVGPRLGAAALSGAGLVVVPGLLGTPRGERLGRGGGWYDRALLHAAPAARRWLLLNDDEVMADLPTETHDLRVTDVVTPRSWIRCRE